jgi:hypothetical protein
MQVVFPSIPLKKTPTINKSDCWRFCFMKNPLKIPTYFKITKKHTKKPLSFNVLSEFKNNTFRHQFQGKDSH